MWQNTPCSGFNTLDSTKFSGCFLHLRYFSGAHRMSMTPTWSSRTTIELEERSAWSVSDIYCLFTLSSEGSSTRSHPASCLPILFNFLIFPFSAANRFSNSVILPIHTNILTFNVTKRITGADRIISSRLDKIKCTKHFSRETPVLLPGHVSHVILFWSFRMLATSWEHCFQLPLVEPSSFPPARQTLGFPMYYHIYCYDGYCDK